MKNYVYWLVKIKSSQFILYLKIFKFFLFSFNLDSPPKKVKTSLTLSNQGVRVVLSRQNYHQRGVRTLVQDILPFKYKS